MKKLIVLFGITLLSASLAGCSGMTKREQGMLAGGAVGGVAGNLVTGGSGVGTAVGAVGGALVGREIAK